MHWWGCKGWDLVGGGFGGGGGGGDISFSLKNIFSFTLIFRQNG